MTVPKDILAQFSGLCVGVAICLHNLRQVGDVSGNVESIFGQGRPWAAGRGACCSTGIRLKQLSKSTAKYSDSFDAADKVDSSFASVVESSDFWVQRISQGGDVYIVPAF